MYFFLFHSWQVRASLPWHWNLCHKTEVCWMSHSAVTCQYLPSRIRHFTDPEWPGSLSPPICSYWRVFSLRQGQLQRHSWPGRVLFPWCPSAVRCAVSKNVARGRLWALWWRWRTCLHSPPGREQGTNITHLLDTAGEFRWCNSLHTYTLFTFTVIKCDHYLTIIYIHFFTISFSSHTFWQLSHMGSQ